MPDETYFDFNADVKLDPNELDVAWLEQPALMEKYCRKLAQTNRAMMTSRRRMNVRRAELVRDIHKDKKQFGLDKVTDSSIESVIDLDATYVKEQELYDKLKFEADVLEGGVEAMKDRRESLRYLTKLYGERYFAGPSIPRDLRAEWDKKREWQKQANTKVQLSRTKK